VCYREVETLYGRYVPLLYTSIIRCCYTFLPIAQTLCLPASFHLIRESIAAAAKSCLCTDYSTHACDANNNNSTALQRVPVFGVGHSLGAKIHVLMNSFPDVVDVARRRKVRAAVTIPNR
jgi:Protein of unknown function (DUF1350)